MHTQSPFNGLKMRAELLLAIRHNNDHMDRLLFLHGIYRKNQILWTQGKTPNPSSKHLHSWRLSEFSLQVKFFVTFSCGNYPVTSCSLLLLLSANGVYILLPTAASDFVTFSRFLKKKKNVLTGHGLHLQCSTDFKSINRNTFPDSMYQWNQNIIPVQRSTTTLFLETGHQREKVSWGKVITR